METNMEISDYVKLSEEQRDRTATTAMPCSGRNVYRLVALILGLLCVLQATLNIYQKASYNTLTEERDQLQARNNNLTEDRDQLQARNNNLTEDGDQLQASCNTLTEERDQLQARNNTLTEERDQLQASNNNATEERDQLKKDIEGLNERIRMFKEGWRTFGDSFYYITTEVKTWEESRQDCLTRGAHLVIINSREEQIFINGLYTNNANAWIGLTDRGREGTWTWVDGTPLITSYWENGQPNSAGGDQDCGEFVHRGSSRLGEWNDDACSAKNAWICEK